MGLRLALETELTIPRDGLDVGVREGEGLFAGMGKMGGKV